MNLKTSLDAIIKKYNLLLEDVYQHKDGWKIITAAGIKRMIHKESIEVRKTLDYYNFNEGAAVVRAAVVMTEGLNGKDTHYQAFGEANPDNCTFKKYIVNVAEKRAEGRAVLQALGLYADKWRSEEEMDEMVDGAKLLEKRKEQTQAATDASLKKIETPKVSKRSLLVKSGVITSPALSPDPRDTNQEPSQRNEDN